MRFTLLALLTLWIAPASRGMFIYLDVEKVPVARVLENLEKKLAADPDSYDLRYQLARVHAMAATPGIDVVAVIKDAHYEGKNGQIQFSEPGSDNGTPEDGPARRAVEKSAKNYGAKHLDIAIKHYEVAMSLMKKSKDRQKVTWLIKPLQLGYAWCLDKAGRREEAIAAYRQALAIAWHQEIAGDFNLDNWLNGMKEDTSILTTSGKQGPGKGSHPHLGVGVSFSEEAIRYLIALLDPKQDAAEIGALSEKKKALSRMPRAVTPILIPLNEGPFESLVEPRAHVTFDLDGSGLPRQWGWIKPQAAWLVFDGKQTGQITSGLQLFGSVTFWIFWRDGYQALGSLDANGDGVLEGDELKGLALWQDTNGNGVSDPGEVKPLSAYGIDRLSCRGETAGPGLRWSRQGVHFKDGTSRASYDWDVPMHTPEASK